MLYKKPEISQNLKQIIKALVKYKTEERKTYQKKHFAKFGPWKIDYKVFFFKAILSQNDL